LLEVSITQHDSAEGSGNFDPTSSCSYSQKELKEMGLECAKTTVPVP
jgi:hypothetical protein